MVHTLLMVLFVLVAISMIVLILLQRGAGAQAGSGFGAGASGTVFGSRGSANFLSSSTKWLAGIFFALALFMAWQAQHEARATGPVKTDLGIMSDLPASSDTTKTPASQALPAAPAQALPAPANIAPATQQPVIAPATAPASSTPPAAAPASPPSAPTENKGG